MNRRLLTLMAIVLMAVLCSLVFRPAVPRLANFLFTPEVEAFDEEYDPFDPIPNAMTFCGNDRKANTVSFYLYDNRGVPCVAVFSGDYKHAIELRHDVSENTPSIRIEPFHFKENLGVSTNPDKFLKHLHQVVLRDSRFKYYFKIPADPCEGPTMRYGGPTRSVDMK